MDAVLRTILEKRVVTNGTETIPLSSSVDAEEGALIQRAIRAIEPRTYLEVGFAYGVSALFAGAALRELGRPSPHHILATQPSGNWKGIGIPNHRTDGPWARVDRHAK